MKIIIAGAGAVGIHLAQLLSQENHDIVLMDGDMAKLEDVDISSSAGDMMTIGLDPTTLNGLKEAGAKDADLFVAVTPYETTNITCCLLAHAMGAAKTVARVDNSEYTKDEYAPLFRSMGIHTLIYPELLAAHDIVDGVKRSWVRQYWEVHDGELILMGIKLRETAKIFDIPFKDMRTKLAKSSLNDATPTQRFHIVAVKRGDNTLIPNGDTVLRLGDIAYFMTRRDDIEYIRELVGKVHYADVRRVIFMGGSRAAVHAINELPEHMRAVVVERDLERCRRLVELITNPRCIVVHGDGTDAAMLKSEDIEHTEAFAALTAHAETNILACLAAKRMGVRKTVAMVENLEFAQLAEKLDIGTIINRKTLAAGRIYREMLKAEVRDVKCLTIANADVAEFVVKPGAKVTRATVRELGLPQDITLGGLVRDGHGQLIMGNTRIQAGDTVVVFCRSNMMGKLDAYFK